MSDTALISAFGGTAPPGPQLARVDIDPSSVQRDLARLVLTLIEFLRRLLEMQAVRRMEAATISTAQAEDLGTALLRAQDAVLDMCARLGVAPETLNLDLGPLGRLM